MARSCRKGVAVVVMALVTAIVLMVAPTSGEIKNKCDNIEPLGLCTADQGPPKPQHLQAVYLRHPTKPEHWFYPPKGSRRIKSYKHPTRTITETEDLWPRWIWHDCGDGYVCLESSRYPHWYLSVNYNRHQSAYGCVVYTLTPHIDARLKVIIINETSRGLLVDLASRQSSAASEDYRDYGLSTYLYIPPRCEGYRQAAEYYNPGPGNFSYRYSYSTGVTRTEAISTTVGVSLNLVFEVTKSIVSAALRGSFSQSWTHEQSISSTEMDTHQLIASIPPGKKNVIWQKVATYGMYEWRSSIFVPCMSDI